MTLYELDSWEHNGRDDSDWYAVVYDSEKDSLDRVLTGTTRGANALHIGPAREKEIPADIKEKAILKLRDILLGMVELGEKERVFEPPIDSLVPGVRVRLTEVHRCMKKEHEATPCEKCSGSGKWTNPRNFVDKRECFACKGTGANKKNFRRAKDEQGKQVWERIEAGSTGIVVREPKSFGKFYANGYNRPDRNNSSCTVKLDDGRELNVSCHKLRLDKEPRSPEELLKIADGYARRGGAFYIPFRTATIRL